MKALTVCQPFAELIARGDKVIENRTWHTSYRGPLAIHAGLSRAWLEHPSHVHLLVFGAIVATAEVYDCKAVGALPPERRGNPHAHGPYCWLLRNVQRLRQPIPVKGRQGLWTFAEL